MRHMLLAAIIVTACGTAEYSVALENATDSKITDADVFFSGFRSIGGSIAPRSGKVDLGIKAPLPEQAIVQWRTADGVMHRQVVEVRRHVPRHFTGRLFFVVRSDNTIDVRTTPPEH